MAAPTQAPPIPEEKEEKVSPNSATLPLSIFSGQDLVPGQTVTLKVVRLLDEEVEVAPAGESESEDEGEVEEESPMEASMGVLEGMAE